MRTSPAGTAARLTTTEAALLGLLACRPCSGYDLLWRVRAGVGYIWAPARSRVYAVLPRLEQAGLATREAVVQERRPDKQVYALTPAGEAAFQAWLEAPEWSSHDELLLKLFFGSRLAPERRVALLEGYRAEETARLEEYREIERRIADDEDERFGYLTLRYGLAAAEARLAWIDETLASLGGGA